MGITLLKRLAAWLSDLRLAIVLLLLIALASAVGTAIPQGDPPSSYIDAYASTPWLGLLHGEQVLQLAPAGPAPSDAIAQGLDRWAVESAALPAG